MTDPIALMTIAAAALAGISIVSYAMLSGWRGWLELQRETLDSRREPNAPGASAGSRIELADLRERVRKLEAIAAGVDL